MRTSLDSTGAPVPVKRPSDIESLGRLLALQGPLVGLAALSSTLSAALGLVPFFVVARMATAVYAEPPRLSEIRPLALAALGAVALRYVFVAAANMVAHVAAFRILHELRLRLARKLSAVPLSFFARHSTGKLKRTLMDDVNQVEAFIAHNFPDGVAAIVVPIATAIALVWVDWRMALASVAVAPFAIAALAIAMSDVGKAHAEWIGIQDRMNASLLEYLRGIHVIKTFGLSARRFGDLSRSIEEGLTWMEGFMRTNGRGYGAFGALHRIVVLERGRVIETGTHAELVARAGAYAALWREQERAKGWRLGRTPGMKPVQSQLEKPDA
jgi:ATP-binding cassette, subfamily B, bacterial IrtA/YbtP